MGIKFTKMNWNSGYNEFSKDIEKTKKSEEEILKTPRDNRYNQLAEIRTQPLIKKNFFRDLMNSLDPRSPVLNRTPIAFDCADEKSFNLDDTFADLFAVEKSREQKLELINKNIKTLEDPRSPIQTIPRTPIVCKHPVECKDEEEDDTKEQQTELKTPSPEDIPLCDPRSPTVEMARTPIILKDIEESEIQETQPNPEKKMVKRLKNIRNKKIFNENYEVLNTPTKAPISKLATHANGARTPLGNINGNKMTLRSNRQQQV
ncbi:hypothetical protein ACFFRR_001542 [Megaselia abdita]